MPREPFRTRKEACGLEGRKKEWLLQGASKDCPTDRKNKIEDQGSCVNNQSPERIGGQRETVHNLELLPAGMIQGKGDMPKDQNRENVVSYSRREL